MPGAPPTRISSRAPITAVIVLTGQYTITLPVLTATVNSRALWRDTISMLKQRRRRSRVVELPELGDRRGGASMSVAGAIATGNASATAASGEWPGSVLVVPVGCGWASSSNPRTETAGATNATVMTANTVQPRWPSQVPFATAATSSSVIGTRQGAGAGTNAMIAHALAAELIAMVSVNSTISAPMGTNAMPSPNASPVGGSRIDSCG
ncbi:hypothetical protein AB0F15_12005 [Amycolatopsis sp. NPDC026612]|uniref:hypothetical protein n=1 Tax=Amycolatopsis sp. NPDC026612 TaxID=3155466 RepID=UPI0033DF8557